MQLTTHNFLRNQTHSSKKNGKMLFVKMNYIKKIYIFNNDAESGTFGNVY